MLTQDFFVNPFAHDIWDTKYRGNSGSIESYVIGLSSLASLGDSKLERRFYDLIASKRFSPGGRILAYAGRPLAKMSLMNCTTHKVQGDTLEDISNAVYSIMRASSRGQGIGIDISKLRPAGAPVANAARTSTGAVSFMEMLNAVGGTIGQEGRRAALLFSINVNHPDIYNFLEIKNTPGKVENANISVKIDDDFMYALQSNNPYRLQFRGHSGASTFHIQTTEQARDIFRVLADSAHRSAEPGILYWDTSKRLSNSDQFGEEWGIVGVNACSEEVLDHEGVCNLGSLNLFSYVKEPFTEMAYFDMMEFKEDIQLAIEFLDNIVDIEIQNKNYISDRQKRSLQYLRRVGLGVMGLADMFAGLGVQYGSDKSHQVVDTVFGQLTDVAYTTSIELAKKKGPARVWYETDKPWSKIVEGGFFSSLPMHLREEIAQWGTRNITLLSIAPTGTISNLYGVSGGIEPIFAREYVRRVRMNGGEEFINYVHPGVQKSRELGLPDNLWLTSHELSPDTHISMLGHIQQYIDASISKTVNFPSTATVEDVEKAYVRAWELGIKGLAIYVDGSRHEQVLYSSDEEEDENACPNCGSELVHRGGCTECVSCYYSRCAI